MKITKKLIEKIEIDKIPILDKGFVKLVDYMGDDNSIVQSARVSYGEGTKTKRNDEKLINYLWKNKHTTPFEMCEIKLHIKAPIFVARQWFRHRTASYNEISARYSEMKDEFYLAELNQLCEQSDKNKQCRDEKLVEDGLYIKGLLEQAHKYTYMVYKELLKSGLARELARGILPVNLYTEFYFKINLKNLLHFLSLRNHSHAQYEIREYAIAIEEIIKILYPVTYEAYKFN